MKDKKHSQSLWAHVSIHERVLQSHRAMGGNRSNFKGRTFSVEASEGDKQHSNKHAAEEEVWANPPPSNLWPLT